MDRCLDFNDLLRAAEEADMYVVGGDPASIFEDAGTASESDVPSRPNDSLTDGGPASTVAAVITTGGTTVQSQRDVKRDSRSPSANEGPRGGIGTPSHQPDRDSDLVREAIRAAAAAASAEARDSQSHCDPKSHHGTTVSPSPPPVKAPRRCSASSSTDGDEGLDDNGDGAIDSGSERESCGGQVDGGASGLRKCLARLEVAANPPSRYLCDDGDGEEDVFEDDVPDRAEQQRSARPQHPPSGQAATTSISSSRPFHPFFGSGGISKPPPASSSKAVSSRDREGRATERRPLGDCKKKVAPRPECERRAPVDHPLPPPKPPRRPQLRRAGSSPSSASSSSPSPGRRRRASSSSSSSSSSSCSSASSRSSSSSSSTSPKPAPQRKTTERPRETTKKDTGETRRKGCRPGPKKAAKNSPRPEDEMVTASIKSVNDKVSVAVVPSGGRKIGKGGSSSVTAALAPTAKPRKVVGGKRPRKIFATVSATSPTPASPALQPIRPPKRSSDAGPWPGSEPPPPGRVRYGGTGDHREALKEDPEVRYASERYMASAGPAPVYVPEMGESSKQYDALVRLIYRGNFDPMSWMQNAKLSGSDRALEQLCQMRFQTCRGSSGSYITGSVARALPHVGDAMAAGNVLWALPHVVGAVAMSRRYDRAQKNFLLHSLRRAYAPMVFPEGMALVHRDSENDVVDICRRISEGLRRMRAAVESGAADSPDFQLDLRHSHSASPSSPTGPSSSPVSSSGSSSPGRSSTATATSGYSSMSISASEGPLPPVEELVDACVLACDVVISALMDGPGGPTRVAEMLSSSEPRESTPPCPPQLLYRFRPLLASWVEDLRAVRDCLVVSRVVGEDRSPRGIEGRLAASRAVAAVSSAIAPFLCNDCSRAGDRASSWDLTTALFSEQRGGVEDGLKRVSDLFAQSSSTVVWPEKRTTATTKDLAAAVPRQPRGRTKTLSAVIPPPTTPQALMDPISTSVLPSSAPGLGIDAPTKKRRRRTLVAATACNELSSQRRRAKTDPHASANPQTCSASAIQRKRKSEDPCCSPQSIHHRGSNRDETAFSGGEEDDVVEIFDDVTRPARGPKQDPQHRRPVDPRIARPDVRRSITPQGSACADADNPPPAKRRSEVKVRQSRPPAAPASPHRVLTALPVGGPHPRGGYRRVPPEYSHTPRPSVALDAAYCDPETTSELIDNPLFPRKWRHALMFDPGALGDIAACLKGGPSGERLARRAAWMSQIPDPEDVKVVIMYCPMLGEDLTGPVVGEKLPAWSERKGGLSFLLAALSNRLCTRDSHAWAGNWTGPPNVSALSARGVLLLSTGDLGFAGAVEYLCLRADSARRKLAVVDTVEARDWPQDGPAVGEGHFYVRAKVDPRSQCCLRWPEDRDLRRVVLTSSATFGPGVFARVENLYQTLYPDEPPLRLSMGSNVTYTVHTRVHHRTVVPLSAREYRDAVLPRFDLCKDMSAQVTGLGLAEADFRGGETHGHRAVNRWGLGTPFRPIYVMQSRRRPFDHPLEVPEETRHFCSEVVLAPDLSAGPAVVDPLAPLDRLRVRLCRLRSQTVTWGPGDGPETTSIDSQGRTEVLPPPHRSPNRSSSSAISMASGSTPRLSSSMGGGQGGRLSSGSQKRASDGGGGWRERPRRGDGYPSSTSSARYSDDRGDYERRYRRRMTYRPRVSSPPSPFGRGWDEEEECGGYYNDYDRYCGPPRHPYEHRRRNVSWYRHHHYCSDDEEMLDGSDCEDEAPLIASVQPAVDPSSRAPPPATCGQPSSSSSSSSCVVLPSAPEEPVTVSDDEDASSDEEGRTTTASHAMDHPSTVQSSKTRAKGNAGNAGDGERGPTIVIRSGDAEEPEDEGEAEDEMERVWVSDAGEEDDEELEEDDQGSELDD